MFSVKGTFLPYQIYFRNQQMLNVFPNETPDFKKVLITISLSLYKRPFLKPHCPFDIITSIIAFPFI